VGIDFGAVAALPDHRGNADLYRYMDDAGFDALWIPDSQSLMREMTVSMTVAALNTERITINGGVANPLTRHPAVLGSALASIDELCSGRAGISISTGDSAVFNLGLRPAKLRDLEDYVLALRGLLRDGEATVDGRTARLVWPEKPVPITMAAEGPRSLRLAGRIADGVIIGMGLTPEAIRGALAYLREGLDESGRTPDDIEIWWFAKWNIADSRDEAVDAIRMTLAASANHAFRFTLDGKFVPDEFHDGIREIQRGYAFAEHEKHGRDRSNARLVDDPRLREYLANRFAITGTVEQFIERCVELQDLGVRRIRLGAAGADHERLLKAVGDQVIPRFRS
jgi:5,10-methylenetetrahydromethanopterin reductase